MGTIRYFAYGSNMSVARLRGRIPTARAIGVGRLADHRLAFHKAGERDRSGKCDIARSRGDVVFGVLYELREPDIAILDRIEGPGYRRETLAIATSDDESVPAQTYRALDINPDLLPYTWYLRHVLEGARAAGLPRSYIEGIENVEAVEDPDLSRTALELAIHSQ